MARRKVCVIVNSRANYGRIKSLMQQIRARDDLELQLVVGASALLYRFGNAIDVITADGFTPNAKVYVVVEGENPTTMAKSTGLAIVELATIFENLRPDVVVTVADRYETLATAVAASYMNIPVAHTQGGEVSGSIDENVRHAITKLSHIHFPATTRAAEYVVRMGESPEQVFMTGCPSLDFIKDMDISLAPLVKRWVGGTGATFDWAKPYMVVLQHPVTTEFGCGLTQINETIKAVHELNIQTMWLWPNVDAGSDDVAKGIRMYREKHNPNFVHFHRNFSPEDYLRLINSSLCIVGNSSSGLREGAFLGVPCVNIGSRQAMRERGHNVVDTPCNSAKIIAAVRHQIDHGRYEQDLMFGDGRAGERMAEILATIPLSIDKKLHYVYEDGGSR